MQGSIIITLFVTVFLSLSQNRCVIWCVLCGIFMIVLLIMAIAGGLAAYFLLNS